MKAMMILGSMLGFVAGVGGSWLGDCAWSTTFWHATVAAFGGGLLGRWWGKIWFAGLADALEQQRRAAAQARADAKPTAKL